MATAKPSPAHHPNTAALFLLMDEHGLCSSDVARLLSRSPKTIYCWRSDTSVIPDHELDRLRLKLRVSELEAELRALKSLTDNQQEPAHA